MPGMDDLARTERLAWEAVEGAPIDRALHEMCVALGGVTGSATLVDPATGLGPRSAFANVDPYLVELIATDFATPASNPLLAALPRMPPAQFQHSSTVFDIEQLKRTRFYADWWVPTGVGDHGGGIFLPAPDGRFVWAVIGCIGDRDWLDKDELRFAHAACGGIARSLRTAAAMAHERASATLTASEPDPAWLLDPRGKLRLANAHARAMLDGQAEPVRRRNGSISLTDPDADRRLAVLVGSVCNGQTAHGAILVRDGPVHARLAVEPGPRYRDERSALVTLRRPRAMVWNADDLRAAYDLTRREAEVAIALAGGNRPQEIGEALGIEPNSVRLYLKRVFAKTGTGGQGPLIAKLLRGRLEHDDLSDLGK